MATNSKGKSQAVALVLFRQYAANNDFFVLVDVNTDADIIKQVKHQLRNPLTQLTWCDRMAQIDIKLCDFGETNMTRVFARVESGMYNCGYTRLCEKPSHTFTLLLQATTSRL